MSQGATKIRQIADAILDDIAAGRLRSGDRIESERNLTQLFNVSLGTVQKALNELAHRGVLAREHGRGTFVRGVGSALDARYVRFRDKDGRDLPLYWHILGHRKVKTSRQLAAFFGADVPLIRIDRSIDVDRKFMLISQFFLSEANFDALTSDAELQDSVNLRKFISERLSLPTLRLEQLLSFEAMSAELARHLDRKPGGVCMAMELRGYTVQDRPLYLQRIQGEPFKDALMLIDTRS